MTAAEFAEAAKAYSATITRTVLPSGKAYIQINRLSGDCLLTLRALDLPAQLSKSTVITFCRHLDLPTSAFGITAHDF